MKFGEHSYLEQEGTMAKASWKRTLRGGDVEGEAQEENVKCCKELERDQTKTRIPDLPLLRLLAKTAWVL